MFNLILTGDIIKDFTGGDPIQTNDTIKMHTLYLVIIGALILIICILLYKLLTINKKNKQ